MQSDLDCLVGCPQANYINFCSKCEIFDTGVKTVDSIYRLENLCPQKHRLKNWESR